MFTLPDLPYPTNALEPFIDTQTMEIHHGKHHAAYAKNLNDALPDKTEVDLEQILRTTDNPKVRNNGGGHYNHSLFWQIMCPATKSGQPEGKLIELLNSTFSDLPTFKEKFGSIALGRFGSGWAWLTVKGGQLTLEDTPNQDLPSGACLLPQISEPPRRLHRRLVECGQLARSFAPSSFKLIVSYRFVSFLIGYYRILSFYGLEPV